MAIMMKQSGALTRTAARQARLATGPQRRTASTIGDAASKIKEAASDVTSGFHKPSSDVPWMVGSLLVFVPTLFYMTAPPSSDAHHAPAVKEKFKPKIRFPDADAEHYNIPESMGDKAGEGRPHGPGDKGLRERADEDGHMADKQTHNDVQSTANNHDARPGLKGDPEKFSAAGQISQQANQAGSGADAQDPKAATAAARAASGDKNSKPGYNTGEAPEVSGEKMGAELTKNKDEKEDTEEADQKDVETEEKTGSDHNK
ncbi:MAG: hypothetical protein CYPHOPRED_002222 [Cyphobasidiales sp. Tagirdzhanova-0007]|nr:MAG: hypothetical protein CYPHOPRED_002222 [Cyphobasidiales sp. Tagirdzhanova-0007]